MIVEILLPILSIFGIGFFLLDLINKVLAINLMKTEKFVYSIVLGTGITIIPWVFIGIIDNQYLFQTWPIIITIIGLIYLGIEIYKKFPLLVSNVEILNELHEFYGKFITQNYVERQKYLLLLIIASIGSLFLVFHLILPLRGYDALWMYIPDSLWYYRQNGFSDINLLNFRLVTKEPLHTMLFTQALYITGNLNIEAVPILFFVGWILIAYIFAQKIWGNQNKSLFSVLLFLVLPFTFYLINFWAYYQDIFIGFFYSATILSFLNLNNLNYKEQKKESLFYILIGSISFSLGLLAKLSGWIVIFTLLLLYPYSKRNSIVPKFILLIIVSYISFRISIQTYLGLGIAIIAFSGFLIFFISKNSENFLNKNKANLYSLLLIPLGIIFGGIWLADTLNKFNTYNSQITNVYFSLPIETIKSEFIGISFHDPSYKIESAHSADFISIIFYLLVGNMFVLLWLLPKLRVILDKDLSFFNIWTLSFLIIWITFHGLTSIRYLTPIIIPLILVVTHGVFKIVEDISGVKDRIPNKIVLLFCLVSYSSYYFPVPLELLFNQGNQTAVSDSFLASAFSYYSNSVLFITFALVFSYTLYYLFKTKKINKINLKSLNKIKNNFIFPLAIILVISFPFIIPLTVFSTSSSNLDEFNSNWNYHQRSNYFGVVNTLLEENSPESGIIVVNMPGLPIYLNQPTVDFYIQSELLFPLFSSNISDFLYFLLDPIEYAENYVEIKEDIPFSFSFDYFIIPNYGHLFYNSFVSSLRKNNYFFPILFNTDLFDNIYENNEFLIFKRLFSSPSNFEGVVDVKIKGTNTQTSIFGKIMSSKEIFNPKIELILNFDLKDVLSAVINSTILFEDVDTRMLVNQSQQFNNISENDLFSIDIDFIDIFSKDTYNFLKEIELNFVFNTITGIRTKNIVLYHLIDGIPLHFKSESNFVEIVIGEGLGI